MAPSKILVVDDDKNLLDLIGIRLEASGYDVTLAQLQGNRPGATLRHDPRSVAQAVMRFYKNHRRD